MSDGMEKEALGGEGGGRERRGKLGGEEIVSD